MKKPVILIKLGGSAITDKTTPYKVRKNIIRRLAIELKKADKKYSYIISHGSGSFGHTSATKYGGKKGYKSKLGIATISKDATWINQIFIDIFVEEGVPVISLRPMSMIISKDGKLSQNFFQVIDEVMMQDLIPVVYGDVIWDKTWKSTIFSGEQVLSELAIYLSKKGYKIEKIIQIGETNGVYDNEGKTIAEINNKNWSQIKQYINKREGYDVTGGMMHKIENALSLSKYGIETIIVNSKENNLSDAINGKNNKGTYIRKF